MVLSGHAPQSLLSTSSLTFEGQSNSTAAGLCVCVEQYQLTRSNKMWRRIDRYPFKHPRLDSPPPKIRGREPLCGVGQVTSSHHHITSIHFSFLFFSFLFYSFSPLSSKEVRRQFRLQTACGGGGGWRRRSCNCTWRRPDRRAIIIIIIMTMSWWFSVRPPFLLLLLLFQLFGVDHIWPIYLAIALNFQISAQRFSALLAMEWWCVHQPRRRRRSFDLLWVTQCCVHIYYRGGAMAHLSQHILEWGSSTSSLYISSGFFLSNSVGPEMDMVQKPHTRFLEFYFVF